MLTIHRLTISRLKFEVLTAMKMSMAVFWFVMSCGLVSGGTLKIEAKSLVSTCKFAQPRRTPWTVSWLRQIRFLSYQLNIKLNVY
jgi:hypothetical protein